MICSKCGSENVIITTEQVGGKTKIRKAGCLYSIGRFCLIVCTGGLWLIIGKRKESGRVAFDNRTIALCQYCGNKWPI
jgi:hypothetical protein